MLLTQDQEMVRDAVRAFAQAELWPNAARWDKEHHFPQRRSPFLAALRCLRHLRCLKSLAVPTRLPSRWRWCWKKAAGDGGTSTISVTNCPVNAILMRYGNAAQKARWLTPLAQGQMLGAFCPTEPHVGSDASGLRTTAVKEGDEYVINGGGSSSSPAARTAMWLSSSP